MQRSLIFFLRLLAAFLKRLLRFFFPKGGRARKPGNAGARLSFFSFFEKRILKSLFPSHPHQGILMPKKKTSPFHVKKDPLKTPAPLNRTAEKGGDSSPKAPAAYKKAFALPGGKTPLPSSLPKDSLHPSPPAHRASSSPAPVRLKTTLVIRALNEQDNHMKIRENLLPAHSAFTRETFDSPLRLAAPSRETRELPPLTEKEVRKIIARWFEGK